MVIGHQKGRDTKEKIGYRNFGMPRPRATARRCA
jgi:acetyl-CoA carboxylase alpha subunit